MSRQAFEKLLGHLPESDRQRLLRVANEYGISLDDPAWVGLVAVEQGVTAVQNMLVELQDTEQQFIERLRAVEQSLTDRLQAAAATLVEDRTTLVLAAEAAREKTLAEVAQALAAASQDVITTTVPKARARTLAGALGIALIVVASAVGIGWWSGRAHLAQAVAETKAELPATVAWAQDIDTPEKRQRALWALSADGEQIYRLAQLNNGFQRWLACEFGKGVGYTQQEGSYTICYPTSPKSHTVAGLAIGKRDAASGTK